LLTIVSNSYWVLAFNKEVVGKARMLKVMNSPRNYVAEEFYISDTTSDR